MRRLLWVVLVIAAAQPTARRDGHYWRICVPSENDRACQMGRPLCYSDTRPTFLHPLHEYEDPVIDLRGCSLYEAEVSQ